MITLEVPEGIKQHDEFALQQIVLANIRSARNLASHDPGTVTHSEEIFRPTPKHRAILGLFTGNKPVIYVDAPYRVVGVRQPVFASCVEGCAFSFNLVMALTCCRKTLHEMPIM